MQKLNSDINLYVLKIHGQLSRIYYKTFTILVILYIYIF